MSVKFDIPQVAEVEPSKQGEEPEVIENQGDPIEEPQDPQDVQVDGKPFLPLFNRLKDQKHFEGIEDLKEPEDEDQFWSLYDRSYQNRVQQEVVGQLSSYLSRTPERFRKLTEAFLEMEEGDIDEDTYISLISNLKPSSISENDLTDEDKAEAYVRQVRSNQGLDNEEIDSIIETLKDKGTLSTTATKLWKQYDSAEAKEQAINSFVDTVEQNKKAKEQERLAFSKAFTNHIDSLGWNASRVDYIKKSFNTGDYANRLTHALSNPNVQAYLVDFLGFYDGEKFDFESYLKQLGVSSAATNAVKKELNNKYFTPSASRSVAQPDEPKNKLPANFTFKPVTKQ